MSTDWSPQAGLTDRTTPSPPHPTRPRAATTRADADATADPTSSISWLVGTARPADIASIASTVPDRGDARYWSRLPLHNVNGPSTPICTIGTPLDELIFLLLLPRAATRGVGRKSP